MIIRMCKSYIIIFKIWYKWVHISKQLSEIIGAKEKNIVVKNTAKKKSPKYFIIRESSS